MKMMTRRFALLGVALSLLSSCAALSAVDDAAVPLDAYALVPLPMAEPSPGGPHLVVEVPNSTGALATDRILIKPNPLQATYLPDGRWIDPAPVMMQSLLVNSLQNVARFSRVGRDGAGLIPDYTLITDLTAFEVDKAEIQTVHVGVTITIIQESDRSILATRRFDQTAAVAADSTPDVIRAFDAATTQLLSEAVDWVSGRVGG